MRYLRPVVHPSASRRFPAGHDRIRDGLLVLDHLVSELLLQVEALVAGLRQLIDGAHDEVKAVQIVRDGHVEGCGEGAVFLVAGDADVVVIGAIAGEAVD